MAELAGVSIATVSRVLNGRDDVSAETRLAVQRVARAYGYAVHRARPRQLPGAAQAARSWKGVVGVTMPYSGPSYFANILSGAVEALYERDMRALLCPTGHQHDWEVSLVRQLMNEQIDGAILVLPEESAEELRALKDQGFCFVVVDPLRHLDHDLPVVSAANASGANQATAHLLSLGHRRIGVITGPPGGVATRARLQGHHSALVAAGIMPAPELEVAGDFLVPGGFAGTERLLALEHPPTAVFAFNDSMAVGALQAARQHGLHVPHDLSVVGFDDTVEAQVAYPALTTVQQPLKEIGRMAVNLLSRLLADHGFDPLRVELATRLVVRESTGPAPLPTAV